MPLGSGRRVSAQGGDFDGCRRANRKPISLREDPRKGSHVGHSCRRRLRPCASYSVRPRLEGARVVLRQGPGEAKLCEPTEAACNHLQEINTEIAQGPCKRVEAPEIRPGDYHRALFGGAAETALSVCRGRRPLG